MQEACTLGAVSRGRVRRVAAEHVDLAGLQRREALLGRERRVLDRLGIAEHGRSYDLAEVDVEALRLPALAGEPEAGHGVVHSATQRAAVLHFLEKTAAAILAAATRLRLAGVARSVTVAAVVIVVPDGASGSEEQDDGEQDA